MAIISWNKHKLLQMISVYQHKKWQLIIYTDCKHIHIYIYSIIVPIGLFVTGEYHEQSWSVLDSTGSESSCGLAIGRNPVNVSARQRDQERFSKSNSETAGSCAKRTWMMRGWMDVDSKWMSPKTGLLRKYMGFVTENNRYGKRLDELCCWSWNVWCGSGIVAKMLQSFLPWFCCWRYCRWLLSCSSW